MASYLYQKDSQYILDNCAKYLSRFNTDFRHDYTIGMAPRFCDSICESWRFPIVDAYGGGATAIENPESYYGYNEVTFIYRHWKGSSPREVGIIGTFSNLFETTPLEEVLFAGEATSYYAVTFAIPKGQSHRYKFCIDGQYFIDPINPQTAILDNGEEWSKFFTEGFSRPAVLEDWQLSLLSRLVEQIIPFRTENAETFLKQFYNYLDRQEKESKYNNAYRLDESVGEVNFIDNLLASQERHRLVDYQICLEIIDNLLRKRNPFSEPSKLPKEAFIELYDQMASDSVSDWDYGKYSSPQFFLDILRRHVVTGSFTHPKYGGNAATSGWSYLESRYRDNNRQTLFNWRRAIEAPLGDNLDYRA